MDRRLFLKGLTGLAGVAAVASILPHEAKALTGAVPREEASDFLPRLDEFSGQDTPDAELDEDEYGLELISHRRHHRRRRRRVRRWRNTCRRYWYHHHWIRRCRRHYYWQWLYFWVWI